MKTMRNTLTYRRRAAVGLAAMSGGAALLVLGIAGPASAHGDQEPEKPAAPVDLSCLEVADHYEIEQDWTEFKVADLPDTEDKTDFSVDGVGTVSVKITDDGSLLEWWSTFGVDAVYVNGTNAEQGSYFYLYEQGDQGEAMHDYHLGVPPWNTPEENQIKSVSFCYDDEGTPPSTVPSTTTPSTTTPPTTEAPTTSVPEETTTTVEETTTTTSAPAATTAPPTTTPPTTETPGGGLPNTGSNTGILVAIGAGLLAVGGALVAARRQIWRRFAS